MNKKIEHSPAPQAERAIYGFFLLIAALFSLFLYVIVSFTPDYIFEYYEFDYLPAKYWSIGVPAFIITFILMIVPFYYSLNVTKVNKLDSMTSIRDEYSLSKRVQKKDVEYSKYSIDPVYDIPIETMNKFLFLANKDV
jgi:hypothetical protein